MPKSDNWKTESDELSKMFGFQFRLGENSETVVLCAALAEKTLAERPLQAQIFALTGLAMAAAQTLPPEMLKLFKKALSPLIKELSAKLRDGITN